MKEKGFTLIEIMVVVGILGLSLASLLQVIFASDMTRQSVDESAQAQTQALGRLEEVRNIKFDDLKNYVLANPTFTVNYLTNATGVLTIDFSNPNLYNITATITWTGATNIQKTYTNKIMVTR